MSLTSTSTAIDALSAMPDESQVVVIDRVVVAPEDAARFLEVWAQKTAYLKRQPGFISSGLHRGRGADGTYVGIAVWESARALREALDSPESRALAARYPRSAAAVPALVELGSAAYRFGSVEIDPGAREVRKLGRDVRLTLKEYQLLLALVSHPRRVFTREELMDIVWGYRSPIDTGTLTVHMRRLREKLEDDPGSPRHFETVWGVGYRFAP